MIHALGNLSSRDLIRWRSSAAISLITIFLMISRQLRSNMGRLGRLAAWHLTGGPVGPAPRWAATSNVEVGQTIYPVNRRRVWREGREGSEGQSHNDENREEGRETGEGTQRPLAQEAGLYLDICVGVLPSSQLRHCWWGRSAYLATAGLKSQSAPAVKPIQSKWCGDRMPVLTGSIYVFLNLIFYLLCNAWPIMVVVGLW